MTIDTALDYVAANLNAADEPLLANFEREIVKRILLSTNGDEAAAAKKLGITKAALRKRL
jgi:DNA-binding protein Fis